MVLVGLILVLLGVPIAIGLSGFPSWAAWLIPLLVAAVFLIWWLDERQPPDQGDSQPGVVALTGMVAVVLAALGAGIGTKLGADRRRQFE